MLVSPHTHCESPLTGSTISTLVERAKELGRTHFAYTDHGHLSSCLKIYKECQSDDRKLEDLEKIGKAHLKRKLNFIPGLEFYFKDTACPFVTGTPADRCKYFTATIYCEDQTAYQELCRLISRVDFPTIDIYEEKQQLWSWKELEHMSKFNVSLVLGGAHCMVGKVMLAGCPDVAKSIFLNLKNIFQDRLFVSFIIESWTKKWNSVVEFELMDGTKTSCLTTDFVTTDKARRIRALDLIEREGHKTLKSISCSGIAKEIHQDIKSTKVYKGFLPLPGGDVLLRVNEFLAHLSSTLHVTSLISDYAYYANKEDKIVQTMRLEGANKLQSNFYMKSSEEATSYLTDTMKYVPKDIEALFFNNQQWASRFDKLELKYDWRLVDVGPDPIRQAMKIIKENGRMQWNNPQYLDRLKEEIEVIAKNPIKDLTSYFLPIRDVLNFYTENGLLVGPGRGSAGGSLFCYLLGITQINPFKYDLPFSRFFSMDRIMMKELPDIDVDLEDRALLVGKDGHSGYLYGRYGEKAAQISTRTTIRLKSAIKDTNRYFKGKVEPEIEVFSKGLPPPGQGMSDHEFVFGKKDDEHPENNMTGLIEISEDLQRYTKNRPEEWAVVSKSMGLTRAFSKHASAFVLSDIPIKDIVPTKDGYVTQYEAKACEKAGLIKYDFLVINQLKDIRVCLDLINKKNGDKMSVGHFNDAKYGFSYIWDLPEDPEVFKSVWGGSCETLFQINTKSMIPNVMRILPETIMDIATIQALVRPGPMDYIDENTGRNMVDEYIMRRHGESEPDIKELAELLPETYGVIVFQEQLTKIGRNLAGFSGTEAENLRKHMAKKNMSKLMQIRPKFLEGATKSVSADTAEAIWERMVTFGRYGFSIIHAVEYATVTYACMFLKHYYPLEWWAAILTNAEEQEITGILWPYVKDIVSPPDINLSSDTMAVDYANGKIRSKLGVIHGMGEATIGPIVAGRPYKDIQDFVNRDVAGPSLTNRLIHVGVLDSLFPPKTNLLEKLKMFADAVEIKKFNEKLSKAESEGKTVRGNGPKQGTIPEEYLNIPPMKDAAMKKAVLPSLPLDLYSLGLKHSKVRPPFETDRPIVISNRGYDTKFINGKGLKRLDEMDGDAIGRDIYVACTCFVVKAEEFAYPKKSPTRRALKMIIDADGYISEKVLWPDYNSGQLMYPAEFKKGCIATIFFRKKVGKKDLNVMQVAVETE